jgi:hypothetical protein
MRENYIHELTGVKCICLLNYFMLSVIIFTTSARRKLKKQALMIDGFGYSLSDLKNLCCRVPGDFPHPCWSRPSGIFLGWRLFQFHASLAGLTITPDRKVRKLMEEYQKIGKLCKVVLRADLDPKTTRKYLKAGKLPSQMKVGHT